MIYETYNKEKKMKLLITLLVLINISIAHAEEGIIKKLQEYDIEIIIFEDANARYHNSEDWPDQSNLINTEAEVNGNTDVSKKQKLSNTDVSNFQNLPALILQQEYNRISNSREYNVLFYGSWRQAGLNKNKAFDIDINDLENLHKKRSENELTGDFKLVLSRFLHFHGNLKYQRNIENTVKDVAGIKQPGQQPGQNTEQALNPTVDTFIYPIKVHRRMRSKVLHYIDHPLIGILIKINPVKASVDKPT